MDSILYKALGLHLLPDNQVTDILAYGAYLLEQLRLGAYGEPPDDEANLLVLSEYALEAPPSQALLSEYLIKMRTEKRIEACMVPAMLCAFPPNKLYYPRRHEQIKAWCLLACLHLAPEAKYESAVNEGARRVRRMTTKNYQWMFEVLPDFDQNLEMLVESLRLLRQELRNEAEHPKSLKSNHVVDSDSELESESEERIEKQPEDLDSTAEGEGYVGTKERSVGHIDNLFRSYMGQLPRKSEHGERTVSPNSVYAVEVTPKPGLEGEELQYTEFYERPENRDISPGVAIDELNRDRPHGAKFVSTRLLAPGTLNRSRTLMSHRIDRIVNRIAVRSMMLPCDWGTMTAYEAETLLADILPQVDDDEAAAMLTLSLLTGRSWERLIALLHPKDMGGQTGQAKDSCLPTSWLLWPSRGICPSLLYLEGRASC